MDHQQARRELACAFRWAARLGYNEGIANHFSAAVSDNGQDFLINTRGTHFSRAQASRLALVTTTDRATDPVASNVDATAWVLHSFIHRNVPRARCILHTHMPYTTALASLKDFEFLMLDQNACRFHDRIAYDRHYAGMALEPSEGERVASLLGDGQDILFLANHGVLVVADTIAQAFDELYYLEQAAQLQVIALSTGRELQLVDNEIAALACKQWREYPESAELHFAALMDILDIESADYIK